MMRKEYSEQQLLDKAEGLCARAEYAESDIRERLYRWGCQNKAMQDSIIQSLVTDGYINPKRYCKAFAHDKLLYQGWGRQKIRMMLRLKQLPADTIDEAIENIDEKAYQKKLNEVMKQKLSQLQADDPQLRDKLIRFLTGRGFEYEEIKETLETITLTT